MATNDMRQAAPSATPADALILTIVVSSDLNSSADKTALQKMLFQ
jgi:hypothetical protein